MKTSPQTEVKDILLSAYGLEPESVDQLEGYDCQNFAVTARGTKFILKIHTADDPGKQFLEAETSVMETFSGDTENAFPECVRTNQGAAVGELPDGSCFRVLKFVEGTLLCDSSPTPETYESLGGFLARMNRRTFGLRNPVIESRRLDWDSQHFRLNEPFFEFITNPADRTLVEYFYMQFKERVEPHFEELRKCFIHADGHDENVLTKEGLVTGMIDFGDVSYSHLINEVAVAGSYIMFAQEDPLQATAPLIKGYNDVVPFEEKELELLYFQIAARLCISVCHSAKARALRPDEVNLRSSEAGAWQLLRRLISINPVRAEDSFRIAAGLKPKIVDTTDSDKGRRYEHTSRALSVTFEKPIKMNGSAFQYMYDSLGNAYLDCYNNIPQVGHCHPRVVAAGQRAMARLNTNTRYLNDAYNDYAENLVSRFPANLNKVFFINSGSAASDLAIRLAMTHTGKRDVLVMEHGYHGNTRLGIDISHYKYNRKGGPGRTDLIIEAVIPDVYKGEFRDTDAGERYAKQALEAAQDADLAAFIAEPVVGCGGQIPLADRYLKSIYPGVREKGGVCISDEVQTGFGRLGKHFWGFEMQGVEPDIVVMGKPMGNGHPLAAVVTTDDIAASFETGMEFFSSFGGNTVSMAIGQAVLDVLDNEKLPENAAVVGKYLLDRLKKIVDENEVAGDARGAGLFLGLELVVDGDPNSPNTALAEHVRNELREKGILVGVDGPDENVIKIKPPICFTKENADRLAGAIEEILTKL